MRHVLPLINICRDNKSKSIRLRGDRVKGRERERGRECLGKGEGVWSGKGWKREGGWLESVGRGLLGAGLVGREETRLPCLVCSLLRQLSAVHCHFPLIFFFSLSTSFYHKRCVFLSDSGEFVHMLELCLKCVVVSKLIICRPKTVQVS